MYLNKDKIVEMINKGNRHFVSEEEDLKKRRNHRKHKNMAYIFNSHKEKN